MLQMFKLNDKNVKMMWEIERASVLAVDEWIKCIASNPTYYDHALQSIYWFSVLFSFFFFFHLHFCHFTLWIVMTRVLALYIWFLFPFFYLIARILFSCRSICSLKSLRSNVEANNSNSILLLFSLSLFCLTFHFELYRVQSSIWLVLSHTIVNFMRIKSN